MRTLFATRVDEPDQPSMTSVTAELVAARRDGQRRALADEVLDARQRAVGMGALVVAAVLVVGLGVDLVAGTRLFRWWPAALVGVLTLFYIAVMWFKISVTVAGMRASAPTVARGGRPTGSALVLVDDTTLPRYTVFVPLYQEPEVVPRLLANLRALDYPPDRLEILLLCEADDADTLDAVRAETLDDRFRLVEVAPSQPRTKPKACNVGLELATGDLCVIYDAEDRPDPEQLLLAAASFARADADTVCLQARLEFYNPETNALTHMFAAEYALNFKLFLRGLTERGHPVPLGGTSNHFRTAALRELGGWDPYNVTEDADLGMWLARRGWRVGMIDSITYEEANSHVGNWIRQRSRWIKGFAQTWLLHMRTPVALYRDLGPADFVAFQIIVGGTPLALLINPLFWLLTVIWFTFQPAAITALYPPIVFYTGLLSFVVGNFVFLYSSMIACLERDLHSSTKWMLAVPVYWVLMSIAAFRGISQLFRASKRHFWEKTRHGIVPEAQA